MEFTKEQKETQEVLAKVLQEACTNKEFKKELIENPLISIEKFIGRKLELKDGFKMKVVDQSEKKTIYLNIPSVPNLENTELSEAQLEMVAAGGWEGALYGALVGTLTLNPVGIVLGAIAGHQIEEAL